MPGPSALVAGQFTWQESEEGVLILEDGAKVLFFQRQPKDLAGRFRRANFVHPLYDLDGQVLTEDFPADHRHHRGVFWAWHQVWLGDMQLAGDPWVARDTEWHVRSLQVERDGPALLVRSVVEVRVAGGPVADGAPQPVIYERIVMRIHPATDNHRQIDFQLKLSAAVAGVKRGGSDDPKGYGGFSVRLRLPEDTQFRGPAGRIEPQLTAVEAGPWVDITATHRPGHAPSGVAILCHPSTPGVPPPWILRAARSMQNPAYPGRHPVGLEADPPLTLRYRLVVHRGRPSRATLEAWHTQYAAD